MVNTPDHTHMGRCHSISMPSSPSTNHILARNQELMKNDGKVPTLWTASRQTPGAKHSAIRNVGNRTRILCLEVQRSAFFASSCERPRHVGVVHDGAPGRKIPVGGDGRCANALPRPNRPLLSCRLTVSGKHGQVTFAFKACDSRRSFRKVAQSAARPVASSCGACPVFDKGCSSRVPRSHLHPIAYHPYSYLQSEEL